MSEHRSIERVDYQRGWRNGFNEGFAEGIKALQKHIETSTDISVSYWLSLNEGVSSKEREFIDLQQREQRARAAGHKSNFYVCDECRDERKSEAGSIYLDWPDVVNGRTLCARHAKPLSSVPSSDTVV